MIKEGKLNPTKNIDEEITYHDPCYLGRHNKILDEPREILEAIPGLEVKELERSRENSFCCGAGGGKIWMEEEAPRVNWNRFEEIENHGVETVAAACPFVMSCLRMQQNIKETILLKSKIFRSY